MKPGFFESRSCKKRGDAKEKGQAIVIIALMLTGLIAIAALVFDGGNAYSQRRRMQNAADAGAFAGARQLALGATDAVICAAIQEYTVTRNGAQSFTATYLPGGEAVCGGSVPGSATSVKVIANTSFSTSFAGLLGENTGAVGANASASLGGVNNLQNNVLPIAPQCAVSNPNTLSDCGFLFNQAYDIWDGGGPGNFGWLAWNNSEGSGAIGSTPMLCANLSEPESMRYTNPNNSSDHALSIGDWVNGNSGVSNSSCVREALEDYIDHQTPITVIIWDTATGHGSGLEYHMVGFAEFQLLGYALSGGGGSSYGDTTGCGGGGGNCIRGKFVKYTIAAPVDPTHNFGLTSVHLTTGATPTPGGAPTNTPAPVPTNTPIGPTSTPVPPTNTPVPPTNTPVTPTLTPGGPSLTPTRTLTPTPTSTPTLTPTPCATPSAPTFSISRNGANVNMSWNAIAGATSYIVYRSTTGPGGSFTLLDTVIGTTDSDHIPNGATYSYYVAAVNNCGQGSPSNVGTVSR